MFTHALKKKVRIERVIWFKKTINKEPLLSKVQDGCGQEHLSEEYLNSKMWLVWLHQLNLSCNNNNNNTGISGTLFRSSDK